MNEIVKTSREGIGLEQIDAGKLANEILQHASESKNEEELKIRVETTLRPILEKWGIRWASYEHRHEISGVRKDALYGHVIIEYKAPGKLDNRAEFNKAKEQVKEYIKKEAVDQKYYGRYFAIVLDGYNIAFVRFRKNEWEEQEKPLKVNAQTVLRLLESIRGLRRKPIDIEFLLLDFGPKSTISKKIILTLYNSLVGKNSPRTEMLFNDWKRVFSQVCSYSKDKLAGLVEYYELTNQEKIDVEKLLFAIHTYYTILMKLLTSEIVTLFADSLLGSYLKKLEEAYYRNHNEMLEELKDLEEGGIFAKLGIRNFLEADYFAWYLDEWNDKIAESIFELIKKLLDYEPATIELNPERVKDLFKRLYQNLVPRDIRHRLGEYFTPDWLAELLLNEVGYDGNPNKRVLDPACGSGTFLVLAIKRIKEYADEYFLDKRELIQKIINNVKGIDLNPLAVLASKANYLIALSDLLRYRPREGIEIPIYLADSISVEIGQKWKTLATEGEEEFRLYTTEGEFWIPKEIIEKNILKEILLYIDEGVKLKYSEEEFREYLSKKLRELNITISKISFGRIMRLYKKIYDLEYKYHKNKIWTQLLKNSFAPLLIGKFDYVVGNPPWINWENLPEFYRNSTKELWDKYGLLEKTKGVGLGKVKRDIAMLFVARCFTQYVNISGKLAFLIPFTLYKTQAGAGFRKWLANKCQVEKIHDLVALYPFEGAVNQTSLIVIKDGKTKFPIKGIQWSGRKISQEEELKVVEKITKRVVIDIIPSIITDPKSSWSFTSEVAHRIINKIIGKMEYSAFEGVKTALNSVYWIKILKHEGEHLLVENNVEEGSKLKVKVVRGIIEKDLVYPLIRGRDVQKWYGNAQGYILNTHNSSGKPIEEKILKIEFPNTYKFLLNFKKDLENRSIHRLWGRKEVFYRLYDIGDYTFSNYKVIWKDIKRELAACVIGSKKDSFLGDKMIIPDATLMLIPVNNYDEAHFVCSILNSLPIELYTRSTLRYLHIPISVVKKVNIPKFNPKDELHLKLSELSKKAHELAKKYYEQNDLVAWEELKKVEEEIDKTVAKLYGITDDELEEIKKTLKILKEGEAEEEEIEEEQIELPKPKDIEIKIEPLFVKENEVKKLNCIISNNSEKALSDIKVSVYLDSNLLSSEDIKKIDKESFYTINFDLPKLKSGEYNLRVVLDIGGSKSEERRKLFVGAEKKTKKIKSDLDKEIEEMLKLEKC
ncbi:MAG: N-6 DNA methylase [Candidatus Aenigmatarchaeota archaeon]